MKLRKSSTSTLSAYRLEYDPAFSHTHGEVVVVLQDAVEAFELFRPEVVKVNSDAGHFSDEFHIDASRGALVNQLGDFLCV